MYLRKLLSSSLCCALLAAPSLAKISPPIGVTPPINPASSSVAAGAAARSAATKYQINYAMSFFSIYDKIIITDHAGGGG